MFYTQVYATEPDPDFLDFAGAQALWPMQITRNSPYENDNNEMLKVLKWVKTLKSIAATSKLVTKRS